MADSKPTTDVALPSETNPKQTIAQLISALQPEIARALPRGLDADRIARLALTVVRLNETLAQSTPASFAGALMTASALGLEPGVNGEAYLVPYKSRNAIECQLIVGYKGLTKLFYQHPLAQNIDAQVVYEKDDFDFAYGTDPYLRHRPATGERGDVIAYYATARLTTGASAFTVLTPDEVKALRRGKVGTSGDIPDPQRWMEKKTVLKQLLKLLPIAPQLAQAISADEQLGSSLRQKQLAESLSSVDTQTGEIEE